MKELISLTIKDRKEAIAAEVDMFSEKYIILFHKKMKQLIKKGEKERGIAANPTTVPSEKTLLRRIEEYFDHYFRWVEDFTTDNRQPQRARRNMPKK